MNSFTDLKEHFLNTVQEVLSIAEKSSVGGDETWDACLHKHGLTPFSEPNRKSRLATIFKLKTGALPIEVRGLLKHLVDQYLSKNVRLQQEATNSMDSIELFQQNQTFLQNWLEPAMQGYVKKVNEDIYRIGYITLKDMRIFMKDLIVNSQIKKDKV